MKNEELLDEIEKIIKTYDKDFDALCIEVAELKGVQKEMIRHNGEKFEEMKKMYDRFIKILLGIITTLFIILMAILGIQGKIPISFIVGLLL